MMWMKECLFIRSLHRISCWCKPRFWKVSESDQHDDDFHPTDWLCVSFFSRRYLLWILDFSSITLAPLGSCCCRSCETKETKDFWWSSSSDWFSLGSWNDDDDDLESSECTRWKKWSEQKSNNPWRKKKVFSPFHDSETFRGEKKFRISCRKRARIKSNHRRKTWRNFITKLLTIFLLFATKWKKSLNFWTWENEMESRMLDGLDSSPPSPSLDPKWKTLNHLLVASRTLTF